jgi:hypothetical protein
LHFFAYCLLPIAYCLLPTANFFPCPIPNWLWAKSAGGASYDYGQSIATDVNGNVYVTGYFYSPSLTFGTTTLTNMGLYDIFVVKYDANGNVLWAKSTGGTHLDEGYGISTDANGNVFVTGYFNSP